MTLQTLITRSFGPQTQIESREEMEKGASSRRYFRITLNEGSHAAPSHVVQMALPIDAMKSDEATTEGAFDELPFVNVQRYLHNAGLPVPIIYLDATAQGHLLLEDLGTVTFNAHIKTKTQDDVVTWYEAAIDLLSQMHDAMWPVPPGCYASQRFFNFTLLRWELDHYREWGVESRLGISLSPQTRCELDRMFNDLASEIDEMPKGFVHRDYQSRNLMVTNDVSSPASLSIIDFQDALTGPRTYDLVALLNDSYVDLSTTVQQRLIERYAQNRHLPVAEIQREFDLITVQRKLKDGGRFVFIDKVKHDPSFLPFVDKSLGRVMSALMRIEGHTELKNILNQIDPNSFTR